MKIVTALASIFALTLTLAATALLILDQEWQNKHVEYMRPMVNGHDVTCYDTPMPELRHDRSVDYYTVNKNGTTQWCVVAH